MDVFEAIYTRRSIKSFDPNHRLSMEEEMRLLEATIQAPTSFNVQHWRFVILRDPALRKKIREEFGRNQPQMTDASLLILITADVKAWQKKPERYWRNLPEKIATSVVSAIHDFYKEREWLQRDEAQRSIGMAAQNLMLAAKALGYASCPMIGFDLDEVSKLVKLPEDYVIGPMIAIGKKLKEPWPKPGQLPLEELVFENHF